MRGSRAEKGRGDDLAPGHESVIWTITAQPARHERDDVGLQLDGARQGECRPGSSFALRDISASAGVLATSCRISTCSLGPRRGACGGWW